MSIPESDSLGPGPIILAPSRPMVNPNPNLTLNPSDLPVRSPTFIKLVMSFPAPSTSGLLPDTTSAQSKIAPPTNPPQPSASANGLSTPPDLGPNPITLPGGEKVRRPVFAPNPELYKRVPGKCRGRWPREEIVG
jgi:hypothetical protein